MLKKIPGIKFLFLYNQSSRLHREFGTIFNLKYILTNTRQINI